MGKFSPSRNDPCPCGSGQKYKRCHERTGEFEPGGRYYGNFSGLSLDARNFILLNAIPDIFGLSKEGDWEKLKRQISGKQIAEFYQLIADLWPINTDFSNLLPNPEGNTPHRVAGGTGLLTPLNRLYQLDLSLVFATQPRSAQTVVFLH